MAVNRNSISLSLFLYIAYIYRPGLIVCIPSIYLSFCVSVFLIGYLSVCLPIVLYIDASIPHLTEATFISLDAFPWQPINGETILLHEPSDD